MTIEEAKEVIEQDIPCEYDSDLIDALNMAIKSLEEWEKVQQEMEDYKYIPVRDLLFTLYRHLQEVTA